MKTKIRIFDGLIWGFAALVLAGPVCAETPYDGTYIGLMAKFISMSNASHGCPTFDTPAPFTVADGHVLIRWDDRDLKGEITKQGELMMRTEAAAKFVGKSDPDGILRGQYSGPCVYSLSWQRRR
jgi:hypothetical protein